MHLSTTYLQALEDSAAQPGVPCLYVVTEFQAMLQVVGAFEQDGQKLPHTLTGKWDTALEAHMADGTRQTIWKVHPLPKVTSRYMPFFSSLGSQHPRWPTFSCVFIKRSSLLQLLLGQVWDAEGLR